MLKYLFQTLFLLSLLFDILIFFAIFKSISKNIIRKHFSKWSFFSVFLSYFLFKRKKSWLFIRIIGKDFILCASLVYFFLKLSLFTMNMGEIIQKNNTFYRMFIILFRRNFSNYRCFWCYSKSSFATNPESIVQVLLNPLFDFQKNEELSQKGLRISSIYSKYKRELHS